ncbi:MAG TPA: peptidylprolyl isomerase [Stellaceae bacterium]|nr:peptidylprolyl isomerase [Stellaceae bacterium]
MRQSLRHAAAVALLAGLAAAVPARADDAIAKLGSQPLTAADFKELLDGFTPQQREQAAKEPKVAAQLVRTAVGRKVVLAEAAKQSWDKKPEVAAQIARGRDDIVIASYLRSVSLPPAGFPSDAEIHAAFDANRERFHQYHVAQIYFADPPGASKETLAEVERKARDMTKKAKAKGADFAALARANSDDTASAAKGGDLGWLPESQILPEILGAVAASGEKGVTDPVHVGGGWHVLTMLGRKQADFAQVHDQIANALRENKFAQSQQAYVDKLLEDQHLSIDETAAAALFAPKK